jgi:hypothetical protein
MRALSHTACEVYLQDGDGMIPEMMLWVFFFKTWNPVGFTLLVIID